MSQRKQNSVGWNAPHQWHKIRNHTDQELRLIVTCAPAWEPELLEFDRSTIPDKE